MCVKIEILKIKNTNLILENKINIRMLKQPNNQNKLAIFHTYEWKICLNNYQLIIQSTYSLSHLFIHVNGIYVLIIIN